MKLLRQMREDLRLETALPLLIAVIATILVSAIFAGPLILTFYIATALDSAWALLLAPAQYLLLWWIDGAYKRAYGQDMFEDLFGRYGA